MSRLGSADEHADFKIDEGELVKSKEAVFGFDDLVAPGAAKVGPGGGLEGVGGERCH